MKTIELKKAVEKDHVPLRLRKAYNNPNISKHSVLTDDAFTYVDFYFKTHKKNRKLSSGHGTMDYSIYWHQAQNFYKAAKVLPVEASPLPMYYCMLNAAKAYCLYWSKDLDTTKKSFYSHGIKEGKYTGDENSRKLSLQKITVARKSQGVFCEFSTFLDSSFGDKWKTDDKFSLFDLLSSLAFVHNAYLSTYNISREKESFIPIETNERPTFYTCTDGKIRLTARLQKSYFSKNLVRLSQKTIESLPEELTVSDFDPLCLISKEPVLKRDIPKKYAEYRRLFSEITADMPLWYLRKTNNPWNAINDLTKIFAVTHRLSEIVRYKPEQMEMLLRGKENWLLHEFISLALDQFIDKISCEITKQEIMPTRKK